MKILNIRFCNINSLKGIHEIDFKKAPLSASGLFAITGATGSGKTTILDVITLALYNKIPRIKSLSTTVIKKNGLILTRNMSDGFAEIEYECPSGTFRSKWSISKTRNNTFRDYQMEIADAGTGELLDGVGRTQVPVKNEELIGLSYDQFVRAILLAQGDFASFLKSDENERGKLLEQITGGDIYRELGKKAYEMNSLHGAELKSLKDRKQDYETRLLPREDYIVLISQLKKAEADILGLNAEKEELGRAMQVKRDIRTISGKIKSLAEAKSQLKESLEKFKNTNGILLEKHSALVPVQDQLVLWKLESEKENAAMNRLDRTKTNIAQLKISLDKLKTQVSRLSGDADENPMSALAKLEERVLKLDNAITVESVKANEKSNIAKQLSYQLQLDYDLNKQAEFRQALELKISDNNKRLASIEDLLGKEVFQDPGQSLIEHRASLQSITTILTEQKLIQQLQTSLSEIKSTRTKVKSSLDELPPKIQLKKTEAEKIKYQLAVQRAESENRILRADLETHRKNLQAGKACPLCGSLEHPLFKEEEVKENELAAKIKELEAAFTLTGGEAVAMQTQLDSETKRNADLKDQEKSAEDQIKERKSKLDSILSDLPVLYHKEDMNEAKTLLEGHIEEIEKYQVLLQSRTKFTELAVNIKQLVEIEEGLTGLREKRIKLYEGNDFQEKVNGIRESWASGSRSLKDALTLSKETNEELEEISGKTNRLKEEILPQISSLGYKEISEALPDLLSAEKAEELGRIKGDIEGRINDVLTESRVLGESLDELKQKDVERNLEELEASTRVNAEKLEQTGGQRDRWMTDKSQHDNYLSEIEKLDKHIGELGKKNLKWELLNTYIGDAEGKKFSTFAQTLTLYKLIILANERLAMLDDRYILDIPKEGEDKSLSVIDQHMGDLRRSIKSLSGGETFLISLALALALSDLAARKVELKSLFIDEGFGSLDKLTLDQTIDTLEKLQYQSGKNIGVISHVEAMQDRITTQIKVSKNGQGHSVIEVV